MAKSKSDKQNDLIDRVKCFMKDNHDTFNVNKDDIKVSRRVVSGLGFGEKDREIWGKNKAEVTINILRPVINKLVSSYDANPFQLDLTSKVRTDITIIKQIFEQSLKENDFNVLISNAIRETAGDGLSYLLAYHEFDGEQVKINLKRLNNQSVFFPDDCKEANGSDAKMVVHADVIDKETAKTDYELGDYELRQSDILNGFDVIENKNQCGLITVYEKLPNGVKVSKIVHSKVVDETILPIKNIPIIRFYGDKVTLDQKDNWRGLYWFVRDQLRQINFTASLQLQRIAQAPTFRFWRPEESITARDLMFANMNGPPKPFMTYKAYDSANKPLPPPADVNVTSDISDVSQLIIGTQKLVSDILGDVGNGELAGNPTAEQILFMQSNNDASISGYIRNAKDSAVQLGRTIIQLIAMTFDGIDAESIEVNAVNGPIVSNTKDKNLRKLLAFTQVITSSPEAAKIAPVIIENLDIDEKAKQFLMMQYGQNQQGQIPPQVQQQMAAKDQQMTQMTTQMAEMQKTISQLQQVIFEYQNDSRSKILIAQMNNENALKIEAMKANASQQELAMKLVAESEKQSAKLQTELQKEMIKAENTVPQTPIWEQNRFVPTVLR